MCQRFLLAAAFALLLHASTVYAQCGCQRTGRICPGRGRLSGHDGLRKLLLGAHFLRKLLHPPGGL